MPSLTARSPEGVRGPAHELTEHDHARGAAAIQVERIASAERAHHARRLGQRHAGTPTGPPSVDRHEQDRAVALHPGERTWMPGRHEAGSAERREAFGAGGDGHPPACEQARATSGHERLAGAEAELDLRGAAHHERAAHERGGVAAARQDQGVARDRPAARPADALDHSAAHQRLDAGARPRRAVAGIEEDELARIGAGEGRVRPLGRPVAASATAGGDAAAPAVDPVDEALARACGHRSGEAERSDPRPRALIGGDDQCRAAVDGLAHEPPVDGQRADRIAVGGEEAAVDAGHSAGPARHGARPLEPRHALVGEDAAETAGQRPAVDREDVDAPGPTLADDLGPANTGRDHGALTALVERARAERQLRGEGGGRRQQRTYRHNHCACGHPESRNTGWSGAMRRSSSSLESGPTPPKKAPTSHFQRSR